MPALRSAPVIPSDPLAPVAQATGEGKTLALEGGVTVAAPAAELDLRRAPLVAGRIRPVRVGEVPVHRGLDPFVDGRGAEAEVALGAGDVHDVKARAREESAAPGAVEQSS